MHFRHGEIEQWHRSRKANRQTNQENAAELPSAVSHIASPPRQPADFGSLCAKGRRHEGSREHVDDSRRDSTCWANKPDLSPAHGLLRSFWCNFDACICGQCAVLGLQHASVVIDSESWDFSGPYDLTCSMNMIVKRAIENESRLRSKVPRKNSPGSLSCSSRDSGLFYSLW